MVSLPVSTDDLELNTPVPFRLHVDRELLKTTKDKLSLAMYPQEQSDFGEDDWSQGAKVAVVKELAEYWRDVYDWEKKEVCPLRLQFLWPAPSCILESSKLIVSRRKS